MTTKEKRDKRAGLVQQMRVLLNTVTGAKVALTADENQSYDRMEAEVDTLGKDITREDKLLVTETELKAVRDNNYRPGQSAVVGKGRPTVRNHVEYQEALFDQYARKGKNGISSEHLNALSTGSDVDGGYLVPEEFETKVTENLVNSDPIRANATVITTASDRNIPIETSAGTFDYVTEGGTFGTSDPQVGRVVLSAFKSGGIVKVSEELLQDSFFDLPSYLNRLASRRWNALEQTAFAVGNGNGRPLGAFGPGTANAGTLSVGGVAVPNSVGTTAASVAISADDLMDFYHTLARAYRDKAAFITSDTMVKMIRKLKTGVSGDKTYLWQPGLTAGQPDRLLGRPIYVSDGAPVPLVGGASTPGNISIVFGDWSYYVIADRLGMSMQVLRELYAATGQVGFRFAKRTDGRMAFAPAFATYQQGNAS